MRKPDFTAVALSFGLASRAIAGFTLLLLISRADGPDAAGRFAVMVAVATGLQPLGELNLRNYYVLKGVPSQFRSYVLARVVGATVAFSLAGFIAAIAFDVPMLVVAMFVIGKGSDSVADMFLAEVLREGKPQLAGAFWLANGAGSIICMSALALAGLGASWIVGSSATVSVVCAAWLAGRHYRACAVPPRTDITRGPALSGILRVSGLSAVALCISSLAISLPQYRLADTGQYAVVRDVALFMYAVVGVDLLLVGINQSTLLRYRESLRSDVNLGNLTWSLFRSWSPAIAACGFVGLALIAMTSELTAGVDLESFAVASPVMLPIFLALTWNGFVSSQLLAHGRASWLVGAACLSLGASGAVSLVHEPTSLGWALLPVATALCTRAIFLGVVGARDQSDIYAT